MPSVEVEKEHGKIAPVPAEAHQQENEQWEVWRCMGSASSRQELGKGIPKCKPLVNLLTVRGSEHQTTGQRIGHMCTKNMDRKQVMRGWGWRKQGKDWD